MGTTCILTALGQPGGGVRFTKGAVLPGAPRAVRRVLDGAVAGALDERQAAIADVMRRVEALPTASLDHFIAGDATSEGAHAIQAANSQTGKVAGRTWRQARNPGAFSYRLGTKGCPSRGGAQALVLVIKHLTLSARGRRLIVGSLV